MINLFGFGFGLFDDAYFNRELLLWMGIILAPIAPAGIIYKMFPGSTAGVQGTFGHWRVKAGGAFAAYLIIQFACQSFADRMLEGVEANRAMPLTATANLVLLDYDGNPVVYTSDDDLLYRSVDIVVEPVPQTSRFRSTIPLARNREQWTINFYLDGYVPVPMVLWSDSVQENLVGGYEYAIGEIRLEPNPMGEAEYNEAGSDPVGDSR
ncbi:MAG: hypothetical protein V3T31_10005 [candidate division Zixibacteria bacterium]